MKRDLSDKLTIWKNQKGRKPLLLQGARQVGKTYLLKEWGAAHFEQCAYLNFERNHEAEAFFSSSKDPKALAAKLEIYLNVKLTPGKSL